MVPSRRDINNAREGHITLFLLSLIPLVAAVAALIHFSPRLIVWWRTKRSDERLRPLTLNSPPMAVKTQLDAIGIYNISAPISRLPKGYRKQEVPLTVPPRPISKSNITRVQHMSTPPIPADPPIMIDNFTPLCGIGVVIEPKRSPAPVRRVKITLGMTTRSQRAAVETTISGASPSLLPRSAAMPLLTLPATVYQPQDEREYHRRETLRQLEGRPDPRSLSWKQPERILGDGSWIVATRRLN